MSLVVLAIRLALFFIETDTHTRTGVGVFHNAGLCFTMELVDVGGWLKSSFRLTQGMPALVV